MRRDIIALLCGLIFIGAVTAAAFVGCGESGSGIPVSGTVTRDGQPIEKASILFVPAKDASGPAVGGVIMNGRYRIGADEGLRAGRYTVRVSLGGVPSRESRSLQQVERAEFEREVTRENPQIDIEL